MLAMQIQFRFPESSIKYCWTWWPPVIVTSEGEERVPQNEMDDTKTNPVGKL